MDRHIVVDEETYNRIRNECVQEFIDNHPEFIGISVSIKFIVQKMVEYYLK